MKSWERTKDISYTGTIKLTIIWYLTILNVLFQTILKLKAATDEEPPLKVIIHKYGF